MNYELAEKLLLEQCSPRWKKTANIIGAVIFLPELETKDEEDTGDLLTEILERLVKQGKLEAAGDLNNWRASEIRYAPESLSGSR